VLGQETSGDASTGNTWELGPARTLATTPMSRGGLKINGGETVINVVLYSEYYY